MPTPRAGYFIDGEQVPSVTTVLRVVSLMPTDVLVQWGANLARQGKDWREERNRASQVGTASHSAIEMYPAPPVREQVEEGVAPWNDSEWTRIEAAFRNHHDWVVENRPQILLQEVQLCSKALRVGGTPDLVVKLKGEPWLLDHKTSKGLSATAVAQVAAYAAMLREQTGIVVKGCKIMHHTHAGKLKVVDLGDAELTAGLHAFVIARELYDLGPVLKKATGSTWSR